MKRQGVNNAPGREQTDEHARVRLIVERADTNSERHDADMRHTDMRSASGRAWPSASKIAPASLLLVTARAATAARGEGFTTLPCGTTVLIASINPLFEGIVGPNRALMA